MPDYGLDTLSREDLLGPAKTPAPVAATPAAPKAPAVDYGLGAMSTQDLLGGPVDPTAEAEKAAALFEASFKDPTEEVKRRNLSKSIEKLTGIFTPAPVMDVKDSERAFRLHEADHATRASPRTSAFLSIQENADVAMQDAKTMAQIEKIVDNIWGPSRDALEEMNRHTGLPPVGAAVKGVLGSIGGLMDTIPGMRTAGSAVASIPGGLAQLPALASDVLVRPVTGPIAAALGAEDPFAKFSRVYSGAAKQSLDFAAALDSAKPDTYAGEVLKDAWRSVVQSVSLMIPGAGLARLSQGAQIAGLPTVAMPAAEKAAAYAQSLRMTAPMGLQSMGQKYAELQGKESPQQAALHALEHGVFEVAGEVPFLNKFLAVSKGATENIARAALKAALPDMAGELGTTLGQNFAEWSNLDVNKGKTWSEFLDEQPEALLHTALVSLVASGMHVGMGKAADMSQRKRVEQVQQALTSIFEQAKQFRMDPVTAETFLNKLTDDAKVFVNADELQNVLAQNNLELDSLPPSIAEQLALPSVTGDVEVSIGELMTTFAGTPGANQIAQHVRENQSGLSAAEWADVPAAEAALLRTAETIAAKQEQTAKTRSEVKVIEDELTKELEALPPLREKPFRPHELRALARVAAALYGTMAHIAGMSPAEVRAWHKPNILGPDGAAPPRAATVTLGAPSTISWKSGKYTFTETRTYEHRADDGRVSRTTVDEDGNTKKEWLIVKKDGAEVWSNGDQLHKDDDYANVTPQRAQEIANEDLPAGATDTAQPTRTLSQGFDHGNAMLNVGLTVGTPAAGAQTIDAALVESELNKMGVQVLSAKEVPGQYPGDNGVMVDELTYVPHLSRPLTADEMLQLTVATQQEAIPQYHNGAGGLYGTPENVAKYGGAFNGMYFKDQAGVSLSDAEQELAQKKTPAKKKATAKPIKDAAALTEAANITNANKIAATGKFDYIRDLKEQLQNAVRAAAQGADLSVTTPEVRKYLADLGTQEALAALQTNSNAVGWYDEKTRQALSVVALVHPEILTDPDARFTFIYALAVTSNGQRVLRNFELAERAYAEWKATGGTMPSEVGAGGPAGKKVHEALARYNDLVAKFGSPAAVEKFMLTEFTAKELAAAGFDAGGENTATVVLGAALLGPKIGNGFFANLYGVFDRLTMDRWLMRTWGRWTGTLLKDNQAAVNDEKKVLKALVRAVRADKEANAAMRQVFAMSVKGEVDKTLLTAKASPWEALAKSGNLEHISDQLKLKSTYPPLRKVLQSSELLDQLRKSGNRLADKLDGSNEAPGGGNQRNWIRAVFNDILQNVVESTGQKMEMADLQALLWYPEKRLYDSAKSDDELGGYEDDEAPDYANAAVALARSKGVSDDAISAALASPADRPAVVRPVAGAAVAGELGSFDDEAAGIDGQESRSELAQLKRNVGAVAGPVVGVHFSKQPRDILASSMWGTGMKGAEGEYVRASADKRLRHRIAFYVNTGNGIVPESDVGSHAHLAVLENLYDADADVLKIWRNNPDERVRESAVLDAGFDGFLTRTFGKGGAVVMLGQRNLQTEYLGNYASTAWDLPKELKDKAVAAAQAVHQKLAGATSREDMRASGKVVQVNSLQDLNETYPEAQAAAFTELLKGFGKPHDAETVAGFLEGRTGTEALAAILATQDVQQAVQARAAVVPSAEIPAAKALAMELSRNPRLVSGQQSIEGWQKDLERIEPETAKLVDWSKFESGKMYYKADLAKTLWQGDSTELFAGGPKRGSFNPLTFDLRLLADANRSTFIHELSHFFMAAYIDMASQPDAPPQLTQFVEDLLGYLFKNVPGGEQVGGAALGQKAGAGETALLAPNGKPSKLNAQQWKQVRTPEFKAWFGDWEKHARAKNPVGSLWSDDSVSKIVDENGEPMVVYHGTQQGGFDIFRPEKGDKHRSPMLFATDDPGTARSYSGRPGEIEVQDQQALDRWEELRSQAAYDEKKLTKAERAELRKLDDLFNHENGGEMESQRGIYHLFLNIRDPNETDFEGANWDGARYGMFTIEDSAGDQYYAPDGRSVFTGDETDGILAQPGNEQFYSTEAHSTGETTNSVAEEALRFKQDGAIIRNVVDDGGKHGYGVDPSDVFVFFDSNQVKSATQNSGAFSRTDDSILRQDGQPATPGPIPEGRTNLERWNAMTLDQQRAYWEFFAEGWEQYAMSGKAPTKALQSAFSAFAKWMKEIYKTLKNFVTMHGTKPLDAELTQYFDRMLATDEELEAARAERGFQTLFKNLAESGMSPGQFADYMALDALQKTEAEELLRSRSIRDMKWLSNAKSKAMKELQAEADELRALVQASVEEELASTPIRQAERWLRKGEMVQDGEQIKAAAGHRLDTAILKAMFPEGAIAGQIDFAKLGRGSNALASSTGTQHPDDVAAIFGFRNGEDLVRQLIEMPPFKEEVQQLTDLRMLEEHGDLASPQAIAKAADEAIHNEAHLKMVATEVWALGNRTGSVAMLTRAAKAFAAQLVDNTVVKKLSPSQYANAATRAGKAAVRALAKKEVDKAANEKRTEMVNAAAAKAAYAAEAEVRAIVNRLRKISAYSDKHSATTSREFGVVQAVRAILSDFGIGQHGEKATKYLNTLSEYDPVLGAVLDDVINKLAPEVKPWDQLKVADLRELHAAINGLWAVARDVRSVELAGERMSLDDARAQLIAKLEETQKTKAPTKAFSLTKAEERNQDFMSFAAKAIRPESWISTKDGLDSYGPWRRLIWNTIDRAQLAYNADKTEKLKQLKALLEPIAADMVDVKIDAPELGGTFGAGRTIGYSELLHAILHTGNLSNKTKLLLGRGWGSLNEDGTLNSANWDTFMSRMFSEGRVTKAHMDFVQATWDLLESMKKGAQEAHKATTGRYFEEIAATPLVTPYGTYRGGYAPAIVDHQLVAEADLRKMQNAAETEVIHSFEKPAGGFTKSRVAGYNQPLELNIAALGRHIDQVLLFSHMSIPVRNVQRVLKGKDLSSALAEQDRAALGSVLAPWLHSAATQTVTEKGKLSYESLSLFTKARSRAGAAIMFANVSNSVQQLTGFFPATLKVSKKELLFAAAKGWYKPRELAASVAEMSPYMQQRLANEVHAMAEEIDHILLNPTRFEKAQDWAIAHSYFLQMAVDTAMSPIIWQAKFNEETARGAAQQEAVDLADAAVRMTQGTNRAIDIAAMEKGSPFYRMFMQFAGYFNTQANLVGEKLAAEALLPKTPAKYGRIGMILAMGWWAPAIATALIVQLFRGGVDDDDQDGEWLDDWLVSTFIGSPIRYAVAAIPVFGTTINAAVNSFNNKPYDDRISVSPAVSLVEGGFRGAQAAYGAIEDPTKAGRAIRDLGTFLSLFTGVPVTPATRAAGFATDVETGKVSPTSGADYARGIITGVASPESKR